MFGDVKNKNNKWKSIAIIAITIFAGVICYNYFGSESNGQSYKESLTDQEWNQLRGLLENSTKTDETDAAIVEIQPSVKNTEEIPVAELCEYMVPRKIGEYHLTYKNEYGIGADYGSIDGIHAAYQYDGSSSDISTRQLHILVVRFKTAADLESKTNNILSSEVPSDCQWVKFSSDCFLFVIFKTGTNNSYDELWALAAETGYYTG
jgi:hypothetical protein